MATNKVISSKQLSTMSSTERLAFYREAAKSLTPAATAQATADAFLVRANVYAAEVVNSALDGRDAYRVTRAMRGM